ncbi:MAG: hypothetical protein KAV87_22520, partial [Desulfobacteraceae bacterium]|nr:hypothetical protein [Desulfobacteraceae bacterium]
MKSIKALNPKVTPGKLITVKDFERLDANIQKLIRAYERTMKALFERWTEFKPYYVAHTKIQTLALLDDKYKGSNWL